MAVKLRERDGKWWLYVDWHGQRKAKCIGTKEAADKAKILLEARLVFGADVVFGAEEETRTARAGSRCTKAAQRVHARGVLGALHQARGQRDRRSDARPVHAEVSPLRQTLPR